MRIELKGIAKVTAKDRTYWYAWRGGPRLEGEPGIARIHRLLQRGRRGAAGAHRNRFRAVITAYKASNDYKTLADSTKRNWGRWLDRIGDYFGGLRIAQFDRPRRRSGRRIRRWRSQWADKPRTADYGMQKCYPASSPTLSIPWARSPAIPAEGIKQLYSGDRSDIIWTESDIARIKASPSARDRTCGRMAAAYTGLRLGPPPAALLEPHRSRLNRFEHRQEQASARGHYSAL